MLFTSASAGPQKRRFCGGPISDRPGGVDPPGPRFCRGQNACTRARALPLCGREAAAYRRTAFSSLCSSSRMLFTSASAGPQKRGFCGGPISDRPGGVDPPGPRFCRGQNACTRARALLLCGREAAAYRRTAFSSLCSSSKMLFTSASASSAVRLRSSERSVRLKATLFLPSGMPAPV